MLGKEPELKQETVRRDIWRYSICTYDNEEGLTACDICGVLRKPLGRVGSNIDKKTSNKGIHASIKILYSCIYCSLRKRSLTRTLL